MMTHCAENEADIHPQNCPSKPQIPHCPHSASVMYRNSVVGLVFSDVVGRVIAANPQFCAMVEYSEAELMRKRWQDFTDPDDIDNDESMAARVADGKVDSYVMTKRYITKTKRVIWVTIRVDAVRDVAGKFLCYLGQVTTKGDVPAGVSPAVDIRSLKTLAWLRTNWAWMAAGLAALGVVIAEILKAYRK